MRARPPTSVLPKTFFFVHQPSDVPTGGVFLGGDVLVVASFVAMVVI